MQRWTKQRRALAALLARGEPMSAQALHEQLLACGEAVSLATVYRALVAMEQEALASRVPGGAGDLWELARAGRMVCARCHRATPLPAAAQTALCGEGFCVQSVQVRGICPACQVQRAQEVPMQEQGKPIIDVVAGFLGSGKTTLIRRLLPVWQAEGSVCIVENEFGDVSIDARVLEDGGSRVVELSSGCICCTLIYDFERELLRILRKYRPQRVVVEPSGVGRLSDIIAALGGKQLGGVFTTGLIAACVDVNRFDAYLKSFADFYADQIRAAGAIFLSRTRGCDPVVLRRALGGVKRLQPHAALISTPWDEVTPQALLAHAMQGEHGSVCACEKCAQGRPCAHEGGHGHEALGIDAETLAVPTSVSRGQMDGFLRALSAAPGVLRAKGFVLVDGAWQLLQHVPGETSLVPCEAAAAGQIVVIGSNVDVEGLLRYLE